MLSEIPVNEIDDAIDVCASELLWEAEVVHPPVDARFVANRLGLVVACNETLPYRAHFVRLADRYMGGGVGHGTIVVGPAERPERQQWAIAHEIGESVAYRVFSALGVRVEEAPADAREMVARCLASCLLLPPSWFGSVGRAMDWDLLSLKEEFSTASHELIARRMLQMRRPVVITLCDNGRVSWRRGNKSARVPPLLPEERAAWRRSHDCGIPTAAALDPSATGLMRVRSWPIHEPGWKREIIRSDVAGW